jgi:hypothetical protein
MAELYIRLVNARDVKQEEVLNPQPLQHYIYKFPPLVSLLQNSITCYTIEVLHDHV